MKSLIISAIVLASLALGGCEIKKHHVAVAPDVAQPTVAVVKPTLENLDRRLFAVEARNARIDAAVRRKIEAERKAGLR